jgi:hypothetical protein
MKHMKRDWFLVLFFIMIAFGVALQFVSINRLKDRNEMLERKSAYFDRYVPDTASQHLGEPAEISALRKQVSEQRAEIEHLSGMIYWTETLPDGTMKFAYRRDELLDRIMPIISSPDGTLRGVREAIKQFRHDEDEAEVWIEEDENQ